MDMLAIFGAFGGGILGATLGALPAFILTGVIAIVGSTLTLAGLNDYTTGIVAFGSFLGPHIAFAGGVAASAYAGNRKKLISNGADISTPLFGVNDGSVLLVGGITGVLGAIILYIYGSVLKIPTDLPGMTVFTLGVITRLLLGKTGLTGKCEENDRNWYSKGSPMINNLIFGLGFGILVCCVGQILLNSGVTQEAIKGSYPVLCFGISALSLIFAQTGFAVPASHHVTLPAATAFALSGNIFIGVAVAVICALFGDVVINTLNSHCDTHIDPPATVIFTSVLLLNLIF